MAGETQITIIGNLTNDPELRYTPSGSAVANFAVASTPRTYDRQTQGWKDGETLYLRVSVWRDQAANIQNSLTKGTRVIIQGNLKSRSYETKEGEKRTVIELEATEVGASLAYAEVQVRRNQSNQGGNQGNANSYDPAAANRNQGGFGGGPQGQPQQGGWPQSGGQQPQQGQGGQWGGQQGGWPQGQQGQPPQGQQWPQAQPPQQDDPWATPGVSNAGGWGNGPQSEPPF